MLRTESSGKPKVRMVPVRGCPCGVDHRHKVVEGDIWESRTDLEPRSQLRIVWPDKDGAIVEQIDRPQDGRFGYTYELLFAGFRRVR